MKQYRIDEVVLCHHCKGEGKIRRNERDFHKYPYDNNLYKTCPSCLGDGRLRKVGEYHYERMK